jgi:hypothetical protein
VPLLPAEDRNAMPARVKNLTRWSVFQGPKSPTYQPRAKSSPWAEKRP